MCARRSLPPELRLVVSGKSGNANNKKLQPAGHDDVGDAGCTSRTRSAGNAWLASVIPLLGAGAACSRGPGPAVRRGRRADAELHQSSTRFLDRSSARAAPGIDEPSNMIKHAVVARAVERRAHRCAGRPHRQRRFQQLRGSVANYTSDSDSPRGPGVARVCAGIRCQAGTGYADRRPGSADIFLSGSIQQTSRMSRSHSAECRCMSGAPETDPGSGHRGAYATG